MISVYSNQFYIDATTCGSPEDDELNKVIRTKDKGFVFIGYTRGYNAASSDFFLYKLDSVSLYGAVDVVGLSEISEKKTSQFKVYPTVCSDLLKVEAEFNSKATCIITNSLGQKLYEEEFITYLEVDMSSYTSVFYSVTIFEEKVQSPISFKIIKTQKEN
jgi:hypothetical protein